MAISNREYIKGLILESLYEDNATATATLAPSRYSKYGAPKTKEELAVLHLHIVDKMFMEKDRKTGQETGNILIVPQLGFVDERDGIKIGEVLKQNFGADIGGFKRIPNGKLKYKNGRVVTDKNGPVEYKDPYFVFNPIKCPTTASSTEVKQILLKTLVAPIAKAVGVLANSENRKYQFSGKVSNSDSNGVTDKDFDLLPDTDSMTKCAKFLASNMCNQITDMPTEADVIYCREALDKLKESIRKSFLNGDYDDIIKKMANHLRMVDKKWGFILGPTNAKNIIAQAVAQGLNPNSPEWPTFVRCRPAWEAMGFYVIDDERLDNPSEVKHTYFINAATKGRVSKSKIRQGMEINGQGNAQGWNSNGTLNQLGDHGKIAIAPITGGVHGAAYDITDVTPIPGTIMSWSLWDKNPGLKNNILGLFNDAALEQIAKDKEEYEAEKKKFDDMAKNDPSIKAQLEQLQQEERTAAIINQAIDMYFANLNDKENKISFKTIPNDPIKTMLQNAFSWAKKLASKGNYTKSEDKVAMLAVLALAYNWGVGVSRLNEIFVGGVTLQNIKDMFNNEERQSEFIDGGIAIADGIIDTVNKYVILLLGSLKDDEEGELSDKVDVVSGEEADALLNEENSLIGNINMNHVNKSGFLKFLGIDENLMAENKFIVKYNNMLNRMGNLYKD